MIFPVLFTFGLANIGFAEPTPESFQVITNEDGTPLVRANGVPSEIDTAREPLVDCLCICTTHIQKFAAAVGRWFHQTFAHDFNPQSAADAEITKDTCIDGNLWSNWVEPQLYIILSLSLSMAVVVVLLTRVTTPANAAFGVPNLAAELLVVRESPTGRSSPATDDVDNLKDI